jgi:hypothetical protein
MATLTHPIEIKGENYTVHYQPDQVAIVFSGTLRLAGMEEYAPVSRLLDEVLAEQPETLTIDLQALTFLNSSGINMLSKFVIKVRQQPGTRMVIVGSQMVPWQGKSLKNLQRLMPALDLRFV